MGGRAAENLTFELYDLGLQLLDDGRKVVHNLINDPVHQVIRAMLQPALVPLTQLPDTVNLAVTSCMW